MKDQCQQISNAVTVRSAALATSSRLDDCDFDNGLEETFQDKSGPMLWGSGNTANDQKLRNDQFIVEIQGLHGRVPGVLRMGGGKLKVSIQEVPREDASGHKNQVYGSHTYDDLSITVKQGPGSKKLEEWAKRASPTDISGIFRRTISVHYLSRDRRTVLKTIKYIGCLPVSLTKREHSTASDEKSLTINYNIRRIEFR